MLEMTVRSMVRCRTG